MRRMVLVVLVVAACGGDKRPGEPKPTQGSSPTAPAVAAKQEIGGIEVPIVAAAHGLVPLDDPMWLTIAAKPTGIIIDGKLVVTLQDGAVDPSDKEGGALGLRIPRLATYVANAVKLQSNDPKVLLVFDRSLPAQLLIEVMFSVKESGLRSFAIAALADDKPMVLPIVLPLAAPPTSGAAPASGDAPVKPVVSITGNGRVIVWSFSGAYGTLAKPHLTLDDATTAPAVLTTELAAFVAAHWKGKARTDADRELVVMPDSTVSLATLVPIMAAVRFDAAGAELFPSLLLVPGVE